MTHRRTQPHRGTLLICVLVCLLVASSIMVATTQSALRARREVRFQHQLRQTELLLDAGILRAARKLQRSDDYRGETWQPDNAIERFANAMVKIRVTAKDPSESSYQIEVVAQLGVGPAENPTETVSLTRRSHTFPYTKADESRSDSETARPE